MLTDRSPGATIGVARGTVAATVTLIVLVLGSFAGPLLHPVDPNFLDLARAAASPSRAYPLGTDESGRDVLSRLLRGGQVSLLLGVAAVLCSLALGITLGALAGWRPGWLDTLIMRFTDAMLSIPAVLLIISAVTFLGASTTSLVIAIGATSWMGLARLVRGELLTLRERSWVEASTALGASAVTTVTRHILPHLMPSILVNATLGVGTAILTESALSFLGLGVQPPAASWGNMLSGAQTYVFTLPWLAAWPGICIVITVVAINVIGDALRDASNPLTRRHTP